jgi:hypothetical protein
LLYNAVVDEVERHHRLVSTQPRDFLLRLSVSQHVWTLEKYQKVSFSKYCIKGRRHFSNGASHHVLDGALDLGWANGMQLGGTLLQFDVNWARAGQVILVALQCHLVQPVQQLIGKTKFKN